MTRTGLAPALTLWKKKCLKSFMIFSSECNTAFILCFLVCFRVIRRVSSYSQLLKEIRKIFNSFFSADLFSFYSSSQLKRASYTLLASELGYNKYNECSWPNTSYTQLIILVSRIQGQSDVTYFFLLFICLTTTHSASSYSRLLKEMRENSLLPFLSLFPPKKGSSRTLPCWLNRFVFFLFFLAT